MGYVSKYTKEAFFIPHPEKQAKEFIAVLVHFAHKYRGSVLFPADDSSLLTVSQFKKQLAEYYIIACPDWEITKKYINKHYTYQIAEAAHIPAPKTYILEDINDVEEYSDKIKYPCLIKPSVGHLFYDIFKEKLIKAHSKDELINAFKQASAHNIKIMLQEYIPGDDSCGINYNSYFRDGKPVAEFTARKVRITPPDGGVPCVVVSEDIPEVINPGRQIIKELGYYGYSCIEFKYNPRDNTYKLLEINGRHNRSCLLAVKCGLNFPLIEYRMLMKRKMNIPSHYRKRIYWIDFTKDFFSAFEYRRLKKKPLRWYFGPYAKKHIFAVFNRKDPFPFIKRCFDICAIGGKLLLRKIREMI